MIPNALASTGPYAGYWGYLKSIHHALGRTLRPDTYPMAELDNDRLMELGRFLRNALEPDSDEGTPCLNEKLFNSIPSRPDYSSGVDLRRRIESVEVFKDFQHSSRKGFDRTLERLISTIDNYLNQDSATLIHKEVPNQEFEILRSIMDSLLSEAEIALQR